MGSIIDNKQRTMLSALKNALHQAESIDILTAFFYFSGFNLLKDELKDKKIRILVGKIIDPANIEEFCKFVKKDPEEDIASYAVRGLSSYGRTQKRNTYMESFISMFNKSVLSNEFDSLENQEIFKMFLEKLKDGTLEIRLTQKDNHSKLFVLTNKPEFSCNGDQKGVVLTGSSNFTYNGLIGQLELNERFSDNSKYDEYKEHFENLWSNAETVDISVKNNNERFIKEIKEKLWIFANPSPYNIFIRILFELYDAVEGETIEAPYDITNGRFLNLKYQIDAIKNGIACIKSNNGVIIADVVGLGKSIVASAIAYNLNMRNTVIVAPPHLVEQWNEYQRDFGLRGVRVFSAGKIEELYEQYIDRPEPILYIIDEAHRYRNEYTINYQLLHQLTRSNADNKVILLTATPYNNKPQDLFALIKLFQTPSHSTIKTVDNLSVRFRELIARYNFLEKKGRKNLSPEIQRQFEILSQKLRLMIDSVVIRRSRIDLSEIKEYAEDLRIQHIRFPEVKGPILEEYDLGKIRELYLSTLKDISNKFLAVRYHSTRFLNNPKEFMKKYGHLFDETDIVHAQGNLVKFIRRLFVMRFESSREAFRASLEALLISYEHMKKWWGEGYVPIKKSGYLPDPDINELEEILNEIDNIKTDDDKKNIRKKVIPIPREMFNERFLDNIENDIKILNEIKENWFGKASDDFDPKYNKVKSSITKLLQINPKRKIVIFSFFAATANYITERLRKDGFRVFLYTGSSTKTDRRVVKENFDASCEERNQKDDYDILLATDALSEGFNLNRAGVIINYDIPYNPTRVVQRIGRINRINKKMFNEIYIYNYFPTDIGEETTLIKGISTLKMLLINNIIGSDTKTLTEDETLQSYFKDRYDEVNTESNEKSWDNEYKNIYNALKNNTVLRDTIMKIPERSKIVRKGCSETCMVSFIKRGGNSVFVQFKNGATEAEAVTAEAALPLFKAAEGEQGYPCDKGLSEKFEKVKEKIAKPYPRIKLDRIRGEAIDKIKNLIALYEPEKDYFYDLLDIIQEYDDLSDGELNFIRRQDIKGDNVKEIVDSIKKYIPENYIIQIKQKVNNIEDQAELILFTEDLRNEN